MAFSCVRQCSIPSVQCENNTLPNSYFGGCILEENIGAQTALSISKVIPTFPFRLLSYFRSYLGDLFDAHRDTVRSISLYL